MTLATRFDQLLAQTTIQITDEQRQQLLALVEMLNKWNKAYNLTSVRDPKEMLIRHIMDSIVLAEHLPQQSKLIDVGTGPGLPGLPLAIMMPDTEFTLLDSLGKRIRFIRQACFEIGIKNVTPVQSRVEEHQPEQGFDGVLSRAFASLADMLSWCHHLPSEKGKFFAMKGIYPEQEIEQMPTGFKLDQSIELNVPELDEQRYLLQLSKTN
ncbi:16S rRNA (guanine(527)-N(7))-methyltransferase RsmG [Catenovulum sp. SM1970]|uniref:16S rRNA (guanine(527)-N(7))-methyltransferase RsmG n=1 Tax=Marinifaba aquimaris TaxID=2741323 RepID=UPI001573F9A5|nr:16S rRNA (guanine(527)-N(7))-methyltransferase RsmG [Marinifaba aquimaris]NTS76245.1 16S rRNA (guanine(527)-N(7))-methyltransferase RsmG [Marinifaba aquimaris]